MTGALLSIRDLRVEFATRKGPLTALDGVSFDIGRGEVLGMVGESGAGKSLTGLAIITEATLSFLGSGMPETMPSLGTLIRIGQNYLFSGEWWIVAFPSLTLAILVLAVNLLGDGMRDAFDPRAKN